MIAFPDRAAMDYDARIPQLVPGYNFSLGLMACHLASSLTGPCGVLVPGCGTGAEILALAKLLPQARFTAFDPSAGMLDAARKRLTAAGIEDRVTLVHGMIDDLSDETYEAATVSLVLHFLPDDGTKVAFLTGIARRLSQCAPLMLFDGIEAEGDDEALRLWLHLQGHEPAVVDAVLQRMRTQWHRTTPEHLGTLLTEAGFGRERPFFRAFGFHGVIVKRRPTR